jgi:hypothetical protein
MNAEFARMILKEAAAQGLDDQPISADDEKAVRDAEEIVEMAREAWIQHVRGKQVKAVLKIAGHLDDSDKLLDPAEVDDEDDELIDERINLAHSVPWEDYDTETQEAILEELDRLWKDLSVSDDDFLGILANVLEYEKVHKDRSGLQTKIRKLYKVYLKVEGEDDEKTEHSEDHTEAAPEPQDEATEGSREAPRVDEESTEKEAEKPIESPVLGRDSTPSQARGEAATNPNGNDPEGIRSYQQRAKAEVDSQRQVIPRPPTDDPKLVPADWTNLSDKQLQELYSQYAALAFYSSYQLQVEERRAFHARQAVHELKNELRVHIEKNDENKKRSAGSIEAEVETDQNVKLWLRAQREHEMNANAHRQERDSYIRVVDSLSRFATLRHDEWQRSGK